MGNGGHVKVDNQRAIDTARIDDALLRLSSVVDAQNQGDPAYEKLIGPDGPGLAYEAARELILEGARRPYVTRDAAHAAACRQIR